MKNQIYILLLLVICLNSCKNKEANWIYFNKTFNEVAIEALNKDKLFCVVLFDSTQMSSKNYIQTLQDEYNYLSSNAIYNFVDINEERNNWYLKWLCPYFLPITCVFANDQKIIDIIPGASKESFLYTKEALKSKTVTDFHWPNIFKLNKKTVIPFLSKILEIRKHLNEGVYIESEIKQLIDS